MPPTNAPPPEAVGEPVRCDRCGGELRGMYSTAGDGKPKHQTEAECIRSLAARLAAIDAARGNDGR